MDSTAAIREVLASADKEKQVNDQLFASMATILRKVNSSKAETKVIGELTADEVDTLMKFVYYGFRHQPQEAGLLLKFHDAAYAVGGVGSIVRVLTDKKMPKEMDKL